MSGEDIGHEIGQSNLWIKMTFAEEYNTWYRKEENKFPGKNPHTRGPSSVADHKASLPCVC